MSSELDNQSNHGLDPLIDQDNLEDYAGGLFSEGSEEEEVEYGITSSYQFTR